MYKRILIATDGSELSAKGLAKGLELAAQLGAHADIVTVSEPWAVGMYDAMGWSAGYVQMGIDVLIIVAALTVSPWPSVLLSAAGAVVLNLILALNHRPGRYTGY